MCAVTKYTADASKFITLQVFVTMCFQHLLFSQVCMGLLVYECINCIFQHATLFIKHAQFDKGKSQTLKENIFVLLMSHS